MATALRAVAIIVMLKGLEKRKFNLEVKLEKIAYTIRTARTISGFPSDGHRPSVCGLEPPIQEPDVQTRHDRVAGLSNSEGSQKVLNMLLAIRTMQKRTGKDLRATFLSGTTISNSLYKRIFNHRYFFN